MSTAHEPALTGADLARHYLIALVRAPDADRAQTAVSALAEAGIRVVEVAFTTPRAADVVAWAGQRYPEVAVGAGTLVRPSQVRDAVSSGARFLVSPGLDHATAKAMLDAGRVSIVGALTPTEVMAVTAFDESVLVKIYPGSLGGPNYLRSLREPFPDLRAVPTGGVTAASLADWSDAGAYAVGAGGALCPRSAVDAGDVGALRRRAAGFLDAVAAMRAHTPAPPDGLPVI